MAEDPKDDRQLLEKLWAPLEAAHGPVSALEPELQSILATLARRKASPLLPPEELVRRLAEFPQGPWSPDTAVMDLVAQVARHEHSADLAVAAFRFVEKNAWPRVKDETPLYWIVQWLGKCQYTDELLLLALRAQPKDVWVELLGLRMAGGVTDLSGVPIGPLLDELASLPRMRSSVRGGLEELRRRVRAG